MEITIGDIYYAADTDERDAIALEDTIEKLKLQREANRLDEIGLAYWLDNCGDGKWYCDHCLQKYECGKRIVFEKG